MLKQKLETLRAMEVESRDKRDTLNDLLLTDTATPTQLSALIREIDCIVHQGMTLLASGEHLIDRFAIPFGGVDHSYRYQSYGRIRYENITSKAEFFDRLKVSPVSGNSYHNDTGVWIGNDHSFFTSQEIRKGISQAVNRHHSQFCLLIDEAERYDAEIVGYADGHRAGNSVMACPVQHRTQKTAYHCGRRRQAKTDELVAIYPRRRDGQLDSLVAVCG